MACAVHGVQKAPPVKSTAGSDSMTSTVTREPVSRWFGSGWVFASCAPFLLDLRGVILLRSIGVNGCIRIVRERIAELCLSDGAGYLSVIWVHDGGLLVLWVCIGIAVHCLRV